MSGPGEGAQQEDAITWQLLRYVFAGVAWLAIGAGIGAAVWLIWN